MFDVNVLGLLMCTKEGFKLMQENKIDDGHIILVNRYNIRNKPSNVFGKSSNIYC